MIGFDGWKDDLVALPGVESDALGSESSVEAHLEELLLLLASSLFVLVQVDPQSLHHLVDVVKGEFC